MKAQLNQWLSSWVPVAGLQALGLHHPDQTTFTRVIDPTFPSEGLECAWRSVADTFQVLKHHQCPALRLRWSFEHSLLHGLARPDGTCLMVFTTRRHPELDAASLEALLLEFHAVGAAPHG